MIRTRKTICPLDCPDSCGIIATIENGKITGLSGDPDHPFTRGFLCQKMRHYARRIHSSRRVLYPQIRTGAKGSGDFKRISWDEAWEILVSRLIEIREKHGGDSLLPYSYAGNMGQINRWAGEAFFHRYGASRLNRTVCSAAAGKAWKAHCGDRPGTPPENAADADLVVAWGINIKTTNIHFWPLIQQSRKKGGKLVVIDPYRNKTAKGADVYLPVKPGGDTALALGALKTILDQQAENRDYINAKSVGFDDLAASVHRLSWDAIELDSGLTRDQIHGFTTLLTQSPRSFIRIGMGMTRNTTGAMSVRAILCLAGALGLFEGKKGQGVLLSSGAFSGNREALIHSSLSQKQTREVNMVKLGLALTRLEPPVRALMVFNANPLSIAPDTSRVRAGLAREDLFTIVHEQVITPTARYADLLLPATTSFENSDLFTAYGHFHLGITEPVIPPVGEAISNFDLFQTLAQKMGYREQAFFQSVNQRIINFASGLTGMDPSLSEDEFTSGRLIHSTLAHGSNCQDPFHFTSGELEQGIPASPCLTANLEFGDPDLLSRFPLKLITPPATHLLNSTFGEWYPHNTGQLWIHPRDAAENGIQHGQLVRLYNHRGSTIRQARVTDDTQAGLLVAEGLYWESAASGNTGINDLTSQKTTDLGEGSTFHESLAAVEPVQL